MPRVESSNFSFLIDQDPLLYEIGRSAEAVFYADSNATLVKLRQLAEYLTRSTAANLGISPDREATFFDLIAAVRSRIDIDEKVIRLLHHLRKKGNEAVHEYKQDRGEAAKALQSARELCVWYYRTFCHAPPSFKPGPFISPRDWQQEEQNQLQEIARLTALLEKGQRDVAQSEALIQALRQQEEQLRAIVDARTKDAEASFELADEQSKRLEQLSATYEAHLAEMARKHANANASNATADISERSRLASEHVQAEWAPEIKLHDAFGDYQLTANQESLVVELEAFLGAGNENVFILAGHAGTGKTFITKGLSEFLAAAGRNCVMTAPTGKAARVITQKSGRHATTIHKKIYSMDDIREYKVDEVDGSETFKFYAELEVNDDADNTVYIVDEASMVSDVYSEGEFFRFGSGRLLSDLMKYINLDHNDHAKKIIFIGDAAQLPPVGMSASPALDQKYLHDKFGVAPIRRFELSEVVRQQVDSGILSSANTLRDSLSRKSFNKLALTLDTPDVFICSDPSDLVAGYMTASGNKVDDVAMIIASSNADVAAFNEQVRSLLFPGHEHVTKGDKLVVVMNCTVAGTPLNNGDLVYVTDVGPQPESRTVTIRNKNKLTGKVDETDVTLQFRHLQIAFRAPDGEVIRTGAKIVESLLYSNHPNLNSDETKALYIDFKRRNPRLPSKGKALRDALREDPYFNALRVKFGYALTCHKAQGSEWPDVFVQCKTYMPPRTEEYFRWLYTAITRASKRIHLLNPPSFTPWSHPSSVPIPTGQPSSNPPPVAVTVDDIDSDTPPNKAEKQCSPDKGSNHVSSSIGDPVLDGIHTAACKRLSGLANAKITGVDHHAWQEAYYVSSGDESTRINIAYNSKGIVTSVTPVPRERFGIEIAALLSDMKGHRFSDNPSAAAGKVAFSRDVFNDFFPVFSEKATGFGLTIGSVIEEQWNLRVELGTSLARGQVAIYCDGGGRITKYMWIGRPPQDQALRESLQATMEALI